MNFKEAVFQDGIYGGYISGDIILTFDPSLGL